MTTPLLTFQALVDHYCQTELLAENKTEKTRKTYRVYLRRWILPRWGIVHLHLIKPVDVEQWLRSLEVLSDGSRAKIRNIMSAVFSHAFDLIDGRSERLLEVILLLVPFEILSPPHFDACFLPQLLVTALRKKHTHLSKCADHSDLISASYSSKSLDGTTFPPNC